MAAGIVNKKGATQLTMVSVIALLAPFCVLPNAAPFVTSQFSFTSISTVRFRLVRMLSWQHLPKGVGKL